MTIYPIKHANGCPDYRYRVSLEWTGHTVEHQVFRFCDEYVSSHSTQGEAIRACEAHNQERFS